MKCVLHIGALMSFALLTGCIQYNPANEWDYISTPEERAEAERVRSFIPQDLSNPTYPGVSTPPAAPRRLGINPNFSVLPRQERLMLDAQSIRRGMK